MLTVSRLTRPSDAVRSRLTRPSDAVRSRLTHPSDAVRFPFDTSVRRCPFPVAHVCPTLSVPCLIRPTDVPVPVPIHVPFLFLFRSRSHSVPVPYLFPFPLLLPLPLAFPLPFPFPFPFPFRSRSRPRTHPSTLEPSCRPPPLHCRVIRRRLRRAHRGGIRRVSRCESRRHV